MKSTKANIAGLISSLQQAEMKSILAGAWPPLKPLPVFKFETVEYRATIDFDKRRGEWVCRKISLPSNTVQELRGGLREITLALLHGEGEVLTEEAEPQERELEKDMNRRLQAIREWKESYESGARYFALREQLSEGQRGEIEDSLRLSLTARQLQFNPKNVAYVFDALSGAGGRFAALIEFAKRKKAKQGTEPHAQGEDAAHEAELEIETSEEFPGNRSYEPTSVPDSNTSGVREQEASEACADADELPALSIKNVLPEQEQASSTDQMESCRASQLFETETSGIVDTHSASLTQHHYDEGQHLPAFADFTAQVSTCAVSVNHAGSSSSRFPTLEISAFQVAVFAALFLSATFAFIVGLTVGRGPIASRLREAPKSMLGMDAKPPTVPEPTHESASRMSAPTVTITKEAGSASKPGEAAPFERNLEVNTRGSENLVKVHSADADSLQSTGSAKGEVSLAHGGAMEPASTATRGLATTMSAARSLPRSTTILVTRPGRGSQPFRVSFPEKAIAATPSLAMSSQLSVLVSAEPGLRATHKSVRLQAGDLVSFVWPRYARPADRNGSGETIRVRATIGPLGQVREVKFVSGSSALLPDTKAAVRQWRYRPTLLDKRPVQAQQDVTIEFRGPQYSSRVSTRSPSHN